MTSHSQKRYRDPENNQCHHERGVPPVYPLSRWYKAKATSPITAVRGDAWHHRSDAISSGFAFIGSSIALLKGWAAADDWAALGVALVILYDAISNHSPPF
jgi:Co/Zn/Cd efflux system component